MGKFKNPIIFLIMMFVFNLGFGGNTHAAEDEWQLNGVTNHFYSHLFNSNNKKNINNYYDGTVLFNLKNTRTKENLGAYCLDINTGAKDGYFYENSNLEDLESTTYKNYKENEEKLRTIISHSTNEDSSIPIRKLEEKCNIQGLREAEVVRATQLLIWKIVHGATEVERTMSVYEQKLFENEIFDYGQMANIHFKHALIFNQNGVRRVYPMSAPLINKYTVPGYTMNDLNKVKRLHKESADRVYKVYKYLNALPIDKELQNEKGSIDIKGLSLESDVIQFKVIPKGKLSEIDIKVKVGDRTVKSFKMDSKESSSFAVNLRELDNKVINEIEKMEDQKITVIADATETAYRLNSLIGVNYNYCKTQTLIGVKPIETHMPIHVERSLKDVNLNIYKLGGSTFKITTPIKHDLTKLSPEKYEELLGEGVGPVKGIKFTYWKVTKEQYEQLTLADADTVDKVKEIIGKENNGKEIGPTDEEGLVVESISIDPEDDLSYYYFVESGGMENVVGSLAVPFAISLPMRNVADIKDENGNIIHPAGTINLDDIYIYPKNLIDKDKPNPKKTVDEKEEVSKSIGEEVTYNLITTIPRNIFRKTKFVFYEKLDPALTYVTKKDDIKVLRNEKEISKDNYDVSIEGQVLTVSMKKEYIQSLTTESGENIFSVKFVAEINSKVTIDQSIDNKFTIKFDNGEGVESEEESNNTKVILGGKKFKKINLSHVGLPGAEFIVQDVIDKNKVLYLCEENEKLFWDEDKSKAKKFISSDKGEFEVAGIALTNKIEGQLNDLGDINITNEIAHKYQLVEVKAPQGYALIKKPIDFDVKLGEYTNKEALEDTVLEVLNKKLIIPQTGAFGSIGIILTGLGISAIAFKKMREE